MYGLICNDSIELVGHSLFLNFRYALYNLLDKKNFKDIYDTNDLNDVTHLFIVDEHFAPNVNIWKKQEIIDKANNSDIKVIVFNFEKIFNSAFPWNIDHQNYLQQFHNLTQLLSDIEDINILKTSFINKQLLSKDNIYIQRSNLTKITDRVLFIGQIEGECYNRRRSTIHTVSQYLQLDIVNTQRRLSYSEFLDTLSKYKFVLNPLGAGEFLNLRYYEIIKLGGIPIQQIVPNMKNHYTELNNEYSINFFDPKELKDLDIQNFTQNTQELFLEDYFIEKKITSLL